MTFLTTLHTNMLIFILWAIVTSLVYRMMPSSILRRSWLLAVNLCFYCIVAGFGYALLMIAVGLWSYYCANHLRSAVHSRRWLWLGIVPVALSLLSLKFIVPFSHWFDGSASSVVSRLIIPLGISYYVLKAISYLVDQYRSRDEHETSWLDYLTYLTFFGQIIAGPIQRYGQWRESLSVGQQTKGLRHSIADYASVYYMLVLGLFMKLVVAHRLSSFVNITFAMADTAPGLQLWLGMLLYAAYIYCDFAGYSLIAIGVTRCFSIHCPDNFRLPYLSLSVREFWQRWHISLSTWLRDYIYIPLGGNRHGAVRRVLNVLITFLVSGLWHGSTFNYLLWGAYHGVLNVLSPRLDSPHKLTVRHAAWIVLTFLLVSFGWLIFATPDVATLADYIHGMLTRTSLSMTSLQASILPFTGDNQCLSYFLVVAFFILCLMVRELLLRFPVVQVGTVSRYLWQVLILTSLMLFGSFSKVSFIYAGF